MFPCIYVNVYKLISIILYWSLFPKVKSIIFQHWFRYWIGADQATSRFLNQWWQVYWRIYASLILHELKALCSISVISNGVHWSHFVVWKVSHENPSNGNIFRVTGHCAGNSPVTGDFPAQRPMMRSFDVFFDLRLNKRLSKQSRVWWFETPSRLLWRHCDVSAWHNDWLSISVFLSYLCSSPYQESHPSNFYRGDNCGPGDLRQLEVLDYLRMIYTAMVFQNLRSNTAGWTCFISFPWCRSTSCDWKTGRYTHYSK